MAGGSGQNILEGRLGNDLYWIKSADDLVLENPGAGSDKIVAGIDFYIPSEFEILTLYPTGNAQRAIGNEGNNLIIGNALAIELLGGAGHNSLQGGAGNDTLQGDAGNDHLIGGDGAGDWISYANLSEFGQNVVVHPANSAASGAAGRDWLQGIEHVLTGAGNDQIIGNAAANHLLEGAGSDMLWGDAGADTLDGGGT
ncbi:MAG: calcium-binding protein [Alphaproteobacteria bacterium]|nr:calcium-binding protein [Alphaproteobacteria bacterium]